MTNILYLHHAKQDPQLRDSFAGKYVRIYSEEHGAYWRGRGNGYTPFASGSDVMAFEDAWAKSHHCGPEKGIVYEEVEVAAALLTLMREYGRDGKLTHRLGEVLGSLGYHPSETAPSQPEIQGHCDGVVIPAQPRG